jgi:nucleoid DNA-binding protein
MSSSSATVRISELLREERLPVSASRRLIRGMVLALVEGRRVVIPGLGSFTPWRGAREGAASLARGDTARVLFEAVGVRFRPAKRLRSMLRHGAHGAARGRRPRG